MYDLYVWESVGFRVVKSDAPSRHRGGVTFFYKELPRFAVEFHQHHGPNVISVHMVTSKQLWYKVGCYLALRDASTLESLITEIVHRPRGAELLVA